MNTTDALVLIDGYIDLYLKSPTDFQRGFTIGYIRFALEADLITAEEYLEYTVKISGVSDNAYSKT